MANAEKTVDTWLRAWNTRDHGLPRIQLLAEADWQDAVLRCAAAHPRFRAVTEAKMKEFVTKLRGFNTKTDTEERVLHTALLHCADMAKALFDIAS